MAIFMKDLIEKHFDFRPQFIKKLNGYENINYLVECDGNRYVFKTYAFDKKLLDILEAENEVLLAIATEAHTQYPLPLPSKDGKFINVLKIDGKEKICRLLSFLEGVMHGAIEQSKEQYRSLGSFLAKLDRKLSVSDNYVYRARQWEWDIQYLPLNEKYLDDIADPHDRNIVRYFMQQYAQRVVPQSGNLRKQLIHNDANEWNILVKENSITGIIDFGDLAWSFLINEVAVAITYAAYTKEEPLSWSVPVLQ
ncbi:MAG: phosphotransferase, partial [Cyclobacteriaceae bacterium]